MRKENNPKRKYKQRINYLQRNIHQMVKYPKSTKKNQIITLVIFFLSEKYIILKISSIQYRHWLRVDGSSTM